MALTNEQLLAERLPHTQNALSDHAEAVCIANLRYTAGSMDLLSVLQPQEGQIESPAELIKLLMQSLPIALACFLRWAAVSTIHRQQNPQLARVRRTHGVRVHFAVGR